MDLDATIEGMRPLFGPFVHKGVDLNVTLDGQARILVDRVELVLVLLNLVVNSSQPIDEIGRSDVSTRIVSRPDEGLLCAPDLSNGPHVLLRAADT